MSRAHSFTITLSNNRTEKQAVEHVRVHDPRIVVPDRAGRAVLLEYLEIPRKLGRAFDLIRLPDGIQPTDRIPDSVRDALELIEVKSTKKRLPNLPHGFFFGATANEFELAAMLGDRFKFCFVCLNPETFGLKYLSLRELEPLISSKRVQYQINIGRAPAATIGASATRRGKPR